MIAIFGMCMIVHPAKPEVQNMGRNNHYYCRDQQPDLIFGKKLFQKKENDPGDKHNQRQQTVMMFFITMVQGVRAN